MFSAPPVTFQRETLAELLVEGKTLFDKHWAEIALNKDRIKLDPDYATYEAMEKAGMLRIYTAREMGVLRGYALWFVKRHPHYRTKTWALSDIFWLERRLRTNRGIFRRAWRKIWYLCNPQLVRSTVGARFFAFIEDQLRKEHVDVIHVTTKTKHQAAAHVLRYLGFEHIEQGFSKYLGD